MSAHELLPRFENCCDILDYYISILLHYYYNKVVSMLFSIIPVLPLYFYATKIGFVASVSLKAAPSKQVFVVHGGIPGPDPRVWWKGHGLRAGYI